MSRESDYAELVQRLLAYGFVDARDSRYRLSLGVCGVRAVLEIVTAGCCQAASSAADQSSSVLVSPQLGWASG
jgi:hypothetical protein